MDEPLVLDAWSNSEAARRETAALHARVRALEIGYLALVKLVERMVALLEKK